MNEIYRHPHDEAIKISVYQEVSLKEHHSNTVLFCLRRNFFAKIENWNFEAKKKKLQKMKERPCIISPFVLLIEFQTCITNSPLQC